MTLRRRAISAVSRSLILRWIESRLAGILSDHSTRGSPMTRREQYIRKYGPVEGSEILRLLATNAANVRWKVYYRDKS